MVLLLFIISVFLLMFFPIVRCACFHPVKLCFYGATDLYHYISQKKYNYLTTGELVAYTGLFGKGKTLSVVHRVVRAYKRYNGKPVWCPRREKFVELRVQVLSNVSLSIPYEPFETLQQIVNISSTKQSIDDINDTLTVTLILGDEFSVQMNSRNFKTNIDPLFLNTLLTCRHYYMSLYYTAQRFSHVDALLRQVTSYVVDCRKLWRFQRQYIYDAWEMENATSTSLIKPLARTCWFVSDQDYNAYDTLACVGNLKKSVSENDMLSAEEIIQLQNLQPANMDAVINTSRQYRKRQKKMQ